MPEGIGSSSCFSQEWFGPGNKPCSSSRKTTVLRWHRQGFKLYWKYTSRAAAPKPKISTETVELIKEMARDNRLWGAERIRGELLKLGLRICKRTIQKYMRQVRTARPRGQNWNTFLHTHAEQIWACDFLPVTDLFFRSLFAFFIIELRSRRVIHIGVTRCPTDAWTAQQLREATAFGESPKYLILDNDGKFGVGFARVAKTSTIEILTTPYHAPRANAICSSCMRSTSSAYLTRICSTSTMPGRIKGSSSRYLNHG
jgi:putative transposase